MVSRRSLFVGAGAVALTGACTKPAKSSKPAKRDPDRVTFMTTLGHTGRDGFAHVASKKGFFDEVGIKVDIQPGQAGVYNHNMLIGNRVDFTTVDLSGAIVRAATEGVDSFRCLAAIQQQTLSGLVVFQGSGITTPRDLNGKTIGFITASAPLAVFPAYAKLASIDVSTVKVVEFPQATLIPSLVAGKIQASSTFVVAKEAVKAAGGGREVTVFPYSDFMDDLYGVVLIARKRTVEGNPDLCKRFRSALLKGLQYAVENPDESGKLIADYVGSGVDAKVAASELRLMRPYVLSGPAVGALDVTKMAKNVALLKSVGLIETNVPADLAPNMLAGV